MFEGNLSEIINKEIFEDMHQAWNQKEGTSRFDSLPSCSIRIASLCSIAIRMMYPPYSSPDPRLCHVLMDVLAIWGSVLCLKGYRGRGLGRSSRGVPAI